ncbi:MAG: hypothetical protein J0I84_11980 [Terrimonas sp.]|nr:hypothetical protein [Terrimonas sp.]OJY93970.1 MAG: hypothetical protein BGP13_01650 [Sphingobacteriales bacterium 40-81]
MDVAFNLKEFYKSLGFNAVFSDKLYNADLLVITRGGDSAMDLSTYSFGLIHFYDYGGWKHGRLIKSLPYSNTIIFSTAPAARKSIIEELGFPENQIHVAFPPVAVKLWTKKIKTSKFRYIHIGNYKPIDNVDAFKEKFNKCVTELGVDVWGMGWNNVVKEEKYHGKLGLFKVSSVYAQSECALGLMYPFQRALTFSGRFWHAPLNGCAIFSEPGLHTRSIPGILETDYSAGDILDKFKTLKNRQQIQENAISYWQEKWNEVKKLAVDSFSILEQAPKVNSSAIVYTKLKAHNTLKKYYQIMEIFKLS